MASLHCLDVGLGASACPLAVAGQQFTKLCSCSIFAGVSDGVVAISAALRSGERSLSRLAHAPLPSSQR
eukprot:509919-Pleurochrysis_carterae.AAC.1